MHELGGGMHQYQCFGGSKFVALVVGCIVVLFVCRKDRPGNCSRVGRERGTDKD